MNKRDALLRAIKELRDKQLQLNGVMWFERNIGGKKKIIVFQDLLDIEEALNGSLEIVYFKEKRGKLQKAKETIKLTDDETERILENLALRFKRKVPYLEKFDPYEHEKGRGA